MSLLLGLEKYGIFSRVLIIDFDCLVAFISVPETPYSTKIRKGIIVVIIIIIIIIMIIIITTIIIIINKHCILKLVLANICHSY